MWNSLSITFATLVVCALLSIVQDSTPGQSSKTAGEERLGGIEKAKSDASGLERYMIIAKNNLFTPLGSGGEVKREEFVLTGIMGKIALIKLADGPATYYVSEGGSFGIGAKLIRIGENSVTIVHEGNEKILKLGEGVSRLGEGREQRSELPRRREQEEMERREHAKRRIEELHRERDELKREIMEMEERGHSPDDAYRRVEEIDHNIRELEASLR